MKADLIDMSGGTVYDATLEEMRNMHEMLRSLDYAIVRLVLLS